MWFIKVYSHFHTSLQFISTISSSPHSIAAAIRASVSIDTVSFLPIFASTLVLIPAFFRISVFVMPLSINSFQSLL